MVFLLAAIRSSLRALNRRAWALCVVVLACWAGVAAAQQVNLRSFDHLKSGFPLTGAHVSLRCESCHLNGVFRGTPRDCNACHTAGAVYARGNMVKTANHPPTNLNCDSCHNTSTYTGARFTHVGVNAGTCTSCHNGATAAGKPVNHAVTSASCDACHRAAAWRPASFNHANVAAGACVTCHTGSGVTGKPATHVPTTAACDSCHRTTAWKPALFSHAGVATGTCATCHNGTSATGKPATGHVPTTQACDACHATTTAWLPVPATYAHAGIAAATCNSCHGGSFANIDVKRAGHVVTTQQCDTCHRTTAWKPATFTHTGVAAGACATCHNGTSATGKPATGHIATTQACDACHATTAAWLPVPATYGHAGIAAATCNSCHGGSFTNIDVKPATHVTTAAQCDNCHRTTAWKPATFTHAGVAPGACATCHNGTQATGKPATGHIATTQACDACHTTTTAWLPVPATYAHAGIVAGSCNSCHGGSFANIDVKAATHIATTAQCDSCHRMTAWKPANFAHQNVTAGSCATCHNGTSAKGKPATGHITTTQACDACHTNTTAWLPVPATYAHTGITAGSCNSCHGGSFANIDVKTATHIPTTAQCDSCHRMTAWKPATFTHTGITPGTCATCHNGTNARGKPATGHITTTQACDACHTNSTAWLPVPATYAHTGIAAGTCISCHGGTFANIDVKAATHIATTAQCDTCHRTTAWKPANFAHQNVTAGSCATCHNGTSARGKPTTGHITTTQACDACHTNYTAWLPVPATYGHAGITAGTCNSCHGGGFANIDVKSTTHIPTTAQCDSCHRMTAWRPATFTHTGVTPGTCATCHNGSNARGKPTTGHITTTQACDACHTNTTAWLPVPATYAHAGITAGTCNSCHGGSFANIDVKPATHITTTAQCDTCHRTTAWKPATFVHTGVTPGSCATCHNGTQARGKPAAGHIPTTQACDACHSTTTAWLPVPATYGHAGIAAGSCTTCHGGSYANIDVKAASHITTTAQCDVCHRTTAWRPATFAHTGVTPGSCATCHNGTQATGKPTSGHIATTQACDACHTNTTAWLPVPATYGHAGIAAGTCNSCHGGTFTNIDVKPATHVTTTLQCDSCHRTSAWKPASFSHTGVTPGSCTTCHNGTQATGKPTTGHIPTTQACDACHTNTASWLPVPATYGHAGVAAGSCSTCHGGSYTNIDVKPAGHVTTTLSCDSCHRTTAWVPANFNHANVTAGTCLQCHNGTTARGKSAGHIPSTTSCDGCHAMTVFKPATMNHTVVAATQCKTCHNGSYTTQGAQGARAKPSNHIPEATQLLNGAAMDCNACHTSTTLWTAFSMNHNNSQGNGSGWCKGCHLSGTSYLGPMQRKSLTHEKSTGVTDCSQSGCHRPLGNKGSTYRNWD